jgi:hypothetical protein
MTATDDLSELAGMRDEDEAAHVYTETWCKGGESGHVVLSGGVRVRCLRVGSGPPLLLMHTVRTQLDHFQLVIPQITDRFLRGRLPGHGLVRDRPWRQLRGTRVACRGRQGRRGARLLRFHAGHVRTWFLTYLDRKFTLTVSYG